MSEQTRVAQGVPQGGQFAAQQYAEAPVSLDQDDQGTYHYPPNLFSVDDMVRFWQQVPIPDSVLSRIESDYATDWAEWSTEQLTFWTMDHPEPGRLAGRGKVAAYEAERQSFTQGLEEQRPPEILRPTARALARMARMYWHAMQMPADTVGEPISQLQILMPDGRTGTSQEFVDWYQLRRIKSAFFYDPDQALTDLTLSGLQAVKTAVDDLRVSRMETDFINEGHSMEGAYLTAESHRD